MNTINSSPTPIFQSAVSEAELTKDTAIQGRAGVEPANPVDAPFSDALLATRARKADFSEYLRTTLIGDAQGHIHEEELQHGVVSFFLSKISPQACEHYQSTVNTVIGSGNPPMSSEDAVRYGLQSAVNARTLSRRDAEMVNGMSFRASQLDENLSALYDNRGSASDMSIAVMKLDTAIQKASAVLKAMEAGRISVEPRLLSTPSNAISGRKQEQQLLLMDTVRFNLD